MQPDCFADEIAIDFPSVEHAVERMRAAFLGARPGDDVGNVDTAGSVNGVDRILRTDLLLSSREAGTGLTVPIDVPIRRVCVHCGGRGETWTEPCRACHGTGESLCHHSVRVSVPPGVVDGARVRFRVSSPHAASVRVEVRILVESGH